MNRTAAILLFVLVVFGLAGTSHGLIYLWLTDEEMTPFGDHVRFIHGDTLDGPVHSNSEIAIMQDPVFYGPVSTTEEDFWRGSGYNPQFLGPPPRFNAPAVQILDPLPDLRVSAMTHGFHYPCDGNQVLVVLDSGRVHCYEWEQGRPFDSTISWTTILPEQACLMFECPIRVKGVLEGRLSIGSAGDILIVDNVLYADADPQTGETPITSSNILMLAAGGDIKIANTPANGRWNSNGLGFEQTNPDSTDVVISALLIAANGTFTFQDQNDPDSGYVCIEPCGCNPNGIGGGPDNRGTAYLYGGVTQMRRGYMFRSTCGSTGYRKHYRYDTRFAYGAPPCYPWGESTSADPDTLYFGNVVVGTTVVDTVIVRVNGYGILGSVYATYPYFATRHPPFYGNRFTIPVSFTPPRTGPFNGVLSVSTVGGYVQVPLRGRGVAGRGPMVLEVSPNPFNLSTMIRYTLPQKSEVRLRLFDILGRTAAVLVDDVQEAGEYAVRLDAPQLASGLYFLRGEAAGQMRTVKLLLVK